jgi:hypothetical protein
VLHTKVGLGMWGSHYIHCTLCNDSISMLAPLSDCTIVEKSAVIQFLWSEWIKPFEIHRKMLAQYGENCILQRTVYQWVRKF